MVLGPQLLKCLAGLLSECAFLPPRAVIIQIIRSVVRKRKGYHPHPRQSLGLRWGQAKLSFWDTAEGATQLMSSLSGVSIFIFFPFNFHMERVDVKIDLLNYPLLFSTGWRAQGHLVQHGLCTLPAHSVTFRPVHCTATHSSNSSWPHSFITAHCTLFSFLLSRPSQLFFTYSICTFEITWCTDFTNIVIQCELYARLNQHISSPWEADTGRWCPERSCGLDFNIFNYSV